MDRPRRYGAGDSVDDLCRACKILRRHTVMAAGPEGTIHRVVCDYCGSQHNFRGGGRAPRSSSRSSSSPAGSSGSPLPLVSEAERSRPPMSLDGKAAEAVDLELLLRRIIREEAGLTPTVPAERWRGGELVLKPGREGLQERSWPIESFFNKVVMIRNRLRMLEQSVNGAEIPQELKLKLQGYVTACYGSLTSFNLLFAEEEDRFRGSGGGG